MGTLGRQDGAGVNSPWGIGEDGTACYGMGRHGTTWDGMTRHRTARTRIRRGASNCMALHGTAWGSASHSIAFRRIHTPAQPQLCQIRAILPPPAAIDIPADDPHRNRRIQHARGREVGKGGSAGHHHRTLGAGRGRNELRVGHGRAWTRMLQHGAAWGGMRRHGTAWDGPDLHRKWGRTGHERTARGALESMEPRATGWAAWDDTGRHRTAWVSADLRQTWGMELHGVAWPCLGQRFPFHRIPSHPHSRTTSALPNECNPPASAGDRNPRRGSSPEPPSPVR
jgi:hypothetical protein